MMSSSTTFSLVWKQRKARVAISYLILLVAIGIMADLFVTQTGIGPLSFTPNEISPFTKSYQGP